MNDTTQQILELYIEECKIKGKLLTIEEFSEDIDNTIGCLLYTSDAADE